MTLIEKIESPDDLKALPVKDLPALAEEIRARIIATVGCNGGHMASNLGVVELTIALHYVFDSPRDGILFDVSHQSYTHKMLTGRAANFSGIRTTGGYSGYFDRRESQHDLFTMGHAGCTPSMALGLAAAATLQGYEGYFVSVVGDGSLTTGLAYEGLSNIVAMNPRNLMIVLNDNGMAISPNVGWIADWRTRWLAHLRDNLELDKDFQTFQEVTTRLAGKVPMGDFFLSLGKGVKSTIQRGTVPGIGRVWDEMGFNYFGPVDGHNIGDLIEMFTRAKEKSDRVPFVHVLTDKGSGYAPSKEDPVAYHQPGKKYALDLTCQVSEPRPTYSAIFSQCLGDLMAADDRIVAISAAMLEGTGLTSLKERFPGRVLDVGIAEEHAVSLAAGMARCGMRPVVCIYSTFMQRCFDQIVHDVCLNDLPVVFAMDRAGFVGQDGATHHGLLDLAFMRLAPNMIVSVPRDENQMCRLLYTGLKQDHPFCLRFPRGESLGVDIDHDLRIIDIPKSDMLKQGGGIYVVTVGEIGDRLAHAICDPRLPSLNWEVVDMRFVKPVDPDLVAALCKQAGSVFVVEEGTAQGGAASALMEAMSDYSGVGPDVYRINVGDCFPDHAEISELRKQYGLDPEDIIDRIKRLTEGS
jgi:1-deoxy-D-xylulose-5-phosphate synthase